jgi:hypothetical protein
MPAINQDVTHWAGDSATIRIPVLDKTGASVDLSGAAARWWMAKNVSATATEDIYVKKSSGSGLTIENSTAGSTIVVTLDPVDTEGKTAGTFYHECEVVDASGNISTVTIGKFILKPTLIPDDLA